jgi:uncharacterized membrane protein YeaQ/YmgE (transglycosylase-associated protein family)
VEIGSLIVWLAVGSLAGWLVGRYRGRAWLNTVVGSTGAVIVGFLLPRLGVFVPGIIGETFAGLVGALLALFVFNLIARLSGSGARDTTGASDRAPKSTGPLGSLRKRVPQEKVFICYRRDDSKDVTGRIYDRLVNEFGDKSVFRDLDSIPIGLDFRKHIDATISQCDACLVVIGKNWLSMGDSSGGRRIDDPRDHVRIEIEAALKRTIPVVPLLVSGAVMPSVEELPPSLQDLAFRNGIPVRPDPDFHRDVDRLVSGLKKG